MRRMVTRAPRAPKQKGEDIKSQATDIVLFFSDTTKAYNQFKQSILDLIDAIPTLSPHQLIEECQKLRRQRAKLEILDQQMFDIFELAGGSIYQETMIESHSIALAKANRASEQLYQKLHELKVTLQENEGIF
jgi:hypothetical protein